MRMRAGLGDCAPSGRIRLDAVARWLQDVAYSDVADVGLADRAFWVLRRTLVTVRTWPRFGNWATVTTACTGLGRMWAHRRTTIADETGRVGVDSLGLWVHLDPVSRRPTPFSELELAMYSPALQAAEADGRRISARLRHPGPPPDPSHRGAWRFRAVDCDVADHVNNAAYWQPLEEELLSGAEPASLQAEIEFRAGTQPGEKGLLADGAMRWLVEPGGELLASIRLLA